MFVKLVCSDSVNETGRNGTHIFECKQVHVTNKGNAVLFSMADEKGAHMNTLHVDKQSGDSVYVMNDIGRTIDSYRWETDIPNPPPID